MRRGQQHCETPSDGNLIFLSHPIGIYCKFAAVSDLLAGFSTITFYAYAREIRVHGFLQREVREMKRMEEER